MLMQTRLAYDSYWVEKRKLWVLKWPGQVVQSVSCMTWTTQVEEALIGNKLEKYLTTCNLQINDIVDLVRGNLSPGATITIEALIVLDVHGNINIYGWLYATSVL